MQKLGLLIFGVLFFWALSLSAQIPAYYSSIDLTQNGNALEQDLSALIVDSHTTLIPYTSSSTDTWDVLIISELSNDDSNNVLLIYGYDDNDDDFVSDRTRSAIESCYQNSCEGQWNREHVFAKSLGNPLLDLSEPGSGTDLHNLRAADSQKNIQRSNRSFGNSSGSSKIIDDNYFYPGDEWKGDVARIIMYMYLRYPTQCEALNVGYSSVNYSPNKDMPDIFLEWNEEDPVSEFESNRNDVIFSYQGNRNPFIDNPYLATLIWGGPIAKDSWDTKKQSYYRNIDVYPIVCDDELFLNNHINDEPLFYKIENNYGEVVQSGETYNSIPIRIDSQGAYVLTLGKGEYKRSTTIFVQKN